jgi:glyoxylase-like metal-dependent hydrolase (beta-lactamase superfamily II)
MKLGESLPIGDDTIVVSGQEMRLETAQPDVANAIVHRAGRTLVIVDTGATPAFRGPLLDAARQLAPWSSVLLLTTHGHLDHVGNNDLIDEIAADAGIRDARHFVPAHDVQQLTDPGSYWKANLGRLAGVLPGFDDTDSIVAVVLGMFAPQRPAAAATRTFEELPLEHLRIGPAHVTGWTFCDGAVHVARTQGHCAGQVVVHLAGPGLLHLSDEPNGPCAAMHDADQVKMLGAVGWALTAVQSGAVALVTEGHQFQLYDSDAATARLTGLLDDAARLDAALQPAASPSCTPAEFLAAFRKASAELSPTTANPSEIFSALAALAKLRDLGMTVSGTGASQRWTRPWPH